MHTINDLHQLQKSKSLRDPSMTPLSSPIRGPVKGRLKEETNFINNVPEDACNAASNVKGTPRKAHTSSGFSHSSRDIGKLFKGNIKNMPVEGNTRPRRRRKFIRCGHANRKLRYKGLNRYSKTFLTHDKWISDSEVAKARDWKELSKQNRSFYTGFHFHGRGDSVDHTYQNISDSVKKRGIKSKEYFLKEAEGSEAHVQRNEADYSEPSPVSFVSKSSSFVSGRSLSCGVNGEIQKESYNRKHGKFCTNYGSKQRCGVPWNWSRVHGKGKSIWDFAGRGFSCGLSDSAIRRSIGFASYSHSSSEREYSIRLDTSERNTSFDSDSESLPLLTEPSISQESRDTNVCDGTFSGELGLYTGYRTIVRRNNPACFKYRSRSYFQYGGNYNGDTSLETSKTNQIWIQKYFPKTFDEILGQDFVTQTLMNDILKNNISSFYLFHGPHGTGKTSCAHIFAASINCSCLNVCQPCGRCHSCSNLNEPESSDVKVIGSFGSQYYYSFQRALQSIITYIPSSQYVVLIVDNCEFLSSHDWKIFSEVVQDPPSYIVFIVITSNLDAIPHDILFRCKQFLFTRLKEIDIISKLQAIVTKEDLEVDDDALNFIASRSNGSMRDAVMTLEQLSLLGKRISLSLVQELVGLIPDDKLVDLLDMALSADTVNTVKCLRELTDSGAEPLTLMSQLATLITDILDGSYRLHEERSNKAFFQKPTLLRDEMSRLRKGLTVLSEAEKQISLTSDKITWLTAAMLQLAPEQPKGLRSLSSGSSAIQSPIFEKSFENNSNVVHHSIKQSQHNFHDKCTAHEGFASELKSANLNGFTKNNTSQKDAMGDETEGTDDLPVYPSTASNEIKRIHDDHYVHTTPESNNQPVHVESLCDNTLSSNSKNLLQAKLQHGTHSVDNGEKTNSVCGSNQSILNDVDIKGCQGKLVSTVPVSSPLHKIRNMNLENDGSQEQVQIGRNFDDQNRMVSDTVQCMEGNPIVTSTQSEHTDETWKERNNFSIVSDGRISFSERIEEENLRLEPKSGGILCWKGASLHSQKPIKQRREKRSRLLKRFVLCGK